MAKYDSNFIGRYAKKNGLGPTELSKIIGGSKQSASCYMSGHTIPMSNTLWEIAEKLGITDMNEFTEKSVVEIKKGRKSK